MEVNFRIKLTKKQREAYDIIHTDECRYLIARWSRQCGKTIFAEIMLIEYLFKPNTFNAYISPTFSQGRKVYGEIVKLLEPTGVITKCNASELTIETKFGSSLKFFTMQSPTSIRGYTVSGILVLDEAAYMPVTLTDGTDPWSSVIMPITKARKPKVLIISTPNGKQGFFYEFYLKAVQGVYGYKEISATIYDDELVDEETIEDIKKAISPLAFEQEFLVTFLDNALTIFPNFDNCFDGIYINGKCWIGIDPSSVGEDNTILTVINSDNVVRQHLIEGTLDVKYEKIASLINTYNPVGTCIESNSIGEVMANEIKKRLKRKNNFITYPSTNETKKEYISMIAVNIANSTIHFEKENKLLYGELATYTFKITKSGNVTYAAKEGYHDDTISSLGMALVAKDRIKNDFYGSTMFVKSKNNLAR